VFPVVTVNGTAHERGRQYGIQARTRIHRSIAGYADLFQHYASWSWARATAEAERFVPAIADFAPDCLEEMGGLAAGADVALADILAINVRTEIMYSARVRAASPVKVPPAPAECSAFASSVPGKHVIVGQNWDWVPFARDTVVVLQSMPDHGPAFVTVVEAGLLAKFGVNSEGLAVMTNAMACTEDVGEAAVPYHVMLRALLACGSTEEALARLSHATRASSANYLLADESGSAVDVEAQPGDASMLHLLPPDEHGVLLHTNHFCSPRFDSTDLADLVPSTSQFRLDRVADVVASAADADGVATYTAALSDHAQYPDSVCRHLDPRVPAAEQTATVASTIVDLTERQVWLSEGQPCLRGYEQLDFSAIWS